MRSIICAVAMAFVSQSAWSADLVGLMPIGQPDWRVELRPYAGLGASYVHHTGHDIDTPLWAQTWTFGGKAFAGVEITRHLSVELAYHFLNGVHLNPALRPWSENSYAVAGSLLFYTVPVFWPFQAFPIRGFARAGAAYKHITDNNAFLTGVEVEGGASFVVGGGVEMDFTNSWFGRVEYEYISKFGTQRAINLQHTPISASLGMRL